MNRESSTKYSNKSFDTKEFNLSNNNYFDNLSKSKYSKNNIDSKFINNKDDIKFNGIKTKTKTKTNLNRSKFMKFNLNTNPNPNPNHNYNSNISNNKESYGNKQIEKEKIKHNLHHKKSQLVTFDNNNKNTNYTNTNEHTNQTKENYMLSKNNTCEDNDNYKEKEEDLNFKNHHEDFIHIKNTIDNNYINIYNKNNNINIYDNKKINLNFSNKILLSENYKKSKSSKKNLFISIKNPTDKPEPKLLTGKYSSKLKILMGLEKNEQILKTEKYLKVKCVRLNANFGKNYISQEFKKDDDKLNIGNSFEKLMKKKK